MKKMIAMQKPLRNNAGFTITEVVVSALILAVAAAGILSAASVMRQPAKESSEDVTAAFLAKRTLDDLRAQLDSVTWSQLQAGGGPFEINKTYDKDDLPMLADVVIDNVTYRLSYTVVADPAGTQARKINLSVDW